MKRNEVKKLTMQRKKQNKAQLKNIKTKLENKTTAKLRYQM